MGLNFRSVDESCNDFNLYNKDKKLYYYNYFNKYSQSKKIKSIKFNNPTIKLPDICTENKDYTILEVNPKNEYISEKCNCEKNEQYGTPQNTQRKSNFINFENSNSDKQKLNTNNDVQEEMDFFENLLSEINKRIYPHMLNVLNKEEYEGSPIYNNYLDREYIAQLVDKVLDNIINSIEEADDINMDTKRGHWCRYSLLRALIEKHILCELYSFRRPYYRYLNNLIWN